MISAAVQPKPAFEHADPAFHSRVPVPPASKPGLFFVLFALLVFIPGLGQDDPLDPFLFGNPFILRRMNTSIAAGLVGRMTKTLLMLLQAGGPLLAIVGIA